MHEEVELRIGGAIYAGWKSVRVRRSIESVAGSFEVVASERNPARPAARAIRPGAAVAVLVAGDTVITGHVDAVTIRLSKDTHEVRIVGRDRAADLVDCAPDMPPGQWTNIDVVELARILASPFGIQVRANVDPGIPFDTVALSPGQTAWELIEEHCRHRQLLPVSDGRGRLELTRAGSGRAATAVVEGENLLEGETTFSWASRHSEYIAKGQSLGSEHVSGPVAAGAVGRARDAEIDRHRPLVVIPKKAVDTEQCAARAKWEATVRAGRGSRARVVVQGWRQATGAIWPVNALVPLRSQSLGISQTLLISEVEYVLDSEGQRTTLALVRREAFDLLATEELAENVIGFTSAEIGFTPGDVT